ncbi:MAG: response regulator [Spirochaetaceae bacterium]|nr:MAG: response regulator [Spirochaetaceae bacterium]
MKVPVEKRTENTEIIGMELAIPPLMPKILVVDDDPTILKLISLIISRRHLTCDTAAGIRSAKSLMEKNRYDIVFLDLMLPDGSGFDLLEERLSFNRSAVVVIITGEQVLDTAVQVIRNGAYDFITKPFSLALFEERLARVVEEWHSRVRYQYYQTHLEGLVGAMTDKLLQTSAQIDRIYDMTVAALGAALDLRDPETEDHCWRVAENSVLLGKTLGLSQVDQRNLRWSAYLHDIGKIGIPEHILSKSTGLSGEEMELVKVHPLLGFKMISNIDFLKGATDVVLFHHEKYDGSGYPYGLKGTDIPLAARIFAIIDAMDAMIYDRPYRKALPFSLFVEELKKQAGRHFDPELVRKFLEFPEMSWRIEEKTERNHRQLHSPQ